jgi:hypothetical protein
MAIITETEPRDKMLSCRDALARAYELAMTTLPADTHGRLAKALELVEAGGVFESASHGWEVQSQSEAGKTYHVNGSCGCEWAYHHPGTRCTHQYAVLLQRKTLQLLEASAASDTGDVGDSVEAMPPAPQPVAPAQPLPDYPFSGTLKGFVGGVDTMLTVRGLNSTEFKANLQAVRALFDAPVPPDSSTGKSSTAQGDGWCDKHQAPMKLNHGKDGRTWLSHRLADGTWCKGR